MVPLMGLIAKASSGITVAVLAGSSIQNMLQTYQIMSTTATETTATITTETIETMNRESALESLQSMKRKDLLELFKTGTISPKSLQSIQGEWDGYLLDNNSKIMTSVSSIITNKLFGRKYQRWNGKAFFSSNNKGVNRFIDHNHQSNNHQSNNHQSNNHQSNNNIIKYEHPFDFTIQSSYILPSSSYNNNDNTQNNHNQNKVLQLRYSPYQSPFSLWNTMVDELRILPLNNNNNNNNCANDDENNHHHHEPTILIGIGSMAWSGGMLNGQPFCLVKNNPHHTTQTRKKNEHETIHT